MTRCYGVMRAGVVTSFWERWEAAVRYWLAAPGSVLVYRAKGPREWEWKRVSL